MLERIHEWDCRLTRRIGGLRFPAASRLALRWFVRLGDGWVWLPIVGAILLTRPLPQARSILGHGLLVLGISLAVYWPLKLKVRRPRPCHRFPGVAAEVPPLDRFSFPSGHVMHNLAVGLTVAHYFPPTGAWLVAAPLAWGLMRIHFGVHFLGDILVGALLGAGSFGLGLWAMSP